MTQIIARLENFQIIARPVGKGIVASVLSKTSTYIYGSVSPIRVPFEFDDFVDGVLSLGEIKANLNIFLVNLEIISEFDSGVIFTVGDSVAQGRLMTSAMVSADKINVYQNEPHYKYSSDTTLGIFASGVMTKGTGEIIIYAL